ncbi:MAG TPA: preprotein translocase subunit SecA [Opitutaceae bacterium]|nr:preprotein translocase subunit SecA [Opitutaceae bacterium]
MISWLFKRFAGRHHKKFVNSCQPIVAKINAFEVEYQALTEEQLRAKTDEFRTRIASGESLDAILPEAFAAVKNAARRLCGRAVVVCDHELQWNMIHFDVQLIGGIALHRGRIAEMATGEGKTLVATLPLYLNALTGENTQLVTVNDYLARRDSEWMGHLYNLLGVSVGCIQQQMPSSIRREMYARDITYGTASEYGFDYLRDNGMATRKEDQVQRNHWYCIVDEVDSILVDEARTPLIISGPAPIEREQPFTRHKPGIESLFSEQTRLCNRLIGEAKTLLEKPNRSQDETYTAQLQMLQVKAGMPRNKQLQRLMENAEFRKLLDKIDLEMNTDFRKDEYYKLKEELFFVIDERQHQADLTERGRTFLRPDNPDAFMMPDVATAYMEIDKDTSKSPAEKEAAKVKLQEFQEQVSEDIHAISQLLRAYSLYERDVQYVVSPDGKIVIVDENTGRIMPGRRWSDGLHGAVEAKENVTIERETRTYATITIQNYFRMYRKLAGMTGTAETEAMEFNDIYKLACTVIPTNKPCIRKDANDLIFKTRREKFGAVIKAIQEAHTKGQPVLVGTVSVDSSEVLSRMLKRTGIVHSVLNAKYHQQEAEIVSRAGQRGAVTIATNMAGRGTDIKLGEGVAELGGLYVIGTERHESRRIDRQLRGRCSRQGDPGMSRFYISLEDDLMRLFASGGMMAKMIENSMKEGEELEHPWLNKSIESAQKKVEQQNYSIRKRLLQYDDVLNKQREVIYAIRNGAIQAERSKDQIFDFIDEEMLYRAELAGFGEKGGPAQPKLEGFVGWVCMHFPVSLKLEELNGLDAAAAGKLVADKIKEAYALKESVEIPEALGSLERFVIINAIDHHWQEHLTEMEDLRKSVGLRSYGQKDPLSEYKSEAYKYFEELMANVRLQICTGLFRTATNRDSFENMMAILSRTLRMESPANTPPPPPVIAHAVASGISIPGRAAPAAAPVPAPAPEPEPQPEPEKQEVQLPKVTIRRELPKVGRNDPCPCGSGKKYKNCHGA